MNPQDLISPVMVTMKGINDDGERMELSIEGLFTETPSGFLLRYEEYSADLDETIITLIDCTRDSVSILKAGSTATSMLFQEGRPFESPRKTPLGVSTMKIFPTRVQIKRRGNTGSVRLAYQMSLLSELSGVDESAMRMVEYRFRPAK